MPQNTPHELVTPQLILELDEFLSDLLLLDVQFEGGSRCLINCQNDQQSGSRTKDWISGTSEVAVWTVSRSAFPHVCCLYCCDMKLNFTAGQTDHTVCAFQSGSLYFSFFPLCLCKHCLGRSHLVWINFGGIVNGQNRPRVPCLHWVWAAMLGMKVMGSGCAESSIKMCSVR